MVTLQLPNLGLLIAFGGITDRLIPLFAIGAFLTFTLSQAGMVVHWRRAMREAEAGHQRNKRRASLAINAVGAATTGVPLAIIIVAKFTEGAWITILVIPCVIVLLKAIRRYYDELTFRLRDDGRLDLHRSKPPIVLVATEGWNRLTDKALDFALSSSPEVTAVHLTKLQGPDADQEAESLRRKWSRDVEQPARDVGLRPPRLMLLQASYRRIHVPLLQFVEQLQAEHPSRTIAVLIPEIVKRRWWENLCTRIAPGASGTRCCATAARGSWRSTPPGT